MSLRVSFELDDDDLEHFRLIMQQARSVAARRTPEDIVASARRLMLHTGVEEMPAFIAQRVQSLQTMMEMITDTDWRLPHEETRRVLQALAYFAESDDLIPDGIPGVGFLDDAIMIELVVRELEGEIDTYREFCQYRDEAPRKSKKQLETCREKLLTQLRERRRQRMGSSAETSAGLLE